MKKFLPYVIAVAAVTSMSAAVYAYASDESKIRPMDSYEFAWRISHLPRGVLK